MYIACCVFVPVNLYRYIHIYIYDGTFVPGTNYTFTWKRMNAICWPLGASLRWDFLLRLVEEWNIDGECVCCDVLSQIILRFALCIVCL